MNYPDLLLLNVGHAVHNADWNWQKVSSLFARIFYVTEGSARLVIGNRTTPLVKGRVYVVPPHTVHSYECDGPFSLYYLHVYEQCFDGG